MSSKADKNHLTLKQKAELCEMSMKPNFNKEKICKDYGIHRTTLNRILLSKDCVQLCIKNTYHRNQLINYVYILCICVSRY